MLRVRDQGSPALAGPKAVSRLHHVEGTVWLRPNGQGWAGVSGKDRPGHSMWHRAGQQGPAEREPQAQGVGGGRGPRSLRGQRLGPKHTEHLGWHPGSISSADCPPPGQLWPRGLGGQPRAWALANLVQVSVLRPCACVPVITVPPCLSDKYAQAPERTAPSLTLHPTPARLLHVRLHVSDAYF